VGICGYLADEAASSEQAAADALPSLIHLLAAT